MWESFFPVTSAPSSTKCWVSDVRHTAISIARSRVRCQASTSVAVTALRTWRATWCPISRFIPLCAHVVLTIFWEGFQNWPWAIRPIHLTQAGAMTSIRPQSAMQQGYTFYNKHVSFGGIIWVGWCVRPSTDFCNWAYIRPSNQSNTELYQASFSSFFFVLCKIIAIFAFWRMRERAAPRHKE